MGRPPEHSQEVRDAVIAANLDRNQPLRQVIRALEAGELQGYDGPYKLPLSTASGWVSLEARNRLKSGPLSTHEWRRMTADYLRTVKMAVDKAKRDSAQGKYPPPKQLVDLGRALKEAEELAAKIGANDDPRPTEQPEVAEPKGLLESIAAKQATEPAPRPAESEPSPTPTSRETTTRPAQPREESGTEHVDTPSPVPTLAATESPEP